MCLLGFSRQGGLNSCTAWTPEHLARLHGRRRLATRPLSGFLRRGDAQPVACTVLPGPLPPLWTSPHRSSPLLCPHPSLPSEDPASWVGAWSGVGEAAPDRMAMTWDMELTSAFSPPRSSQRAVERTGSMGLESGFSFVFFFSVFFKDEILTRIALYMLGTGRKDFGMAVGWGAGGHQQPNTCCFRSCFYFQKPSNATAEPSAPPCGVARGLPHLTTPHGNLCVLPQRHPNSLYIYTPLPLPSL